MGPRRQDERETMETYHFTFGSDHLNGTGLDKYVTVEGASYDQARDIIVALFGIHWCAQYSKGDFEDYITQYHPTEYAKVTVTVNP
jgi:hypothetical protein